jgi:hypothetical protein
MGILQVGNRQPPIAVKNLSACQNCGNKVLTRLQDFVSCVCGWNSRMTREDIQRKFGKDPTVAVGPQPTAVSTIDFMPLRKQLNDFTSQFTKTVCPICNQDLIRQEPGRGGKEYIEKFGQYVEHEQHPCTCPDFPKEIGEGCVLHGATAKKFGKPLGERSPNVVACTAPGCVHGKIQSGVECGECHGSGWVPAPDSARAETSDQDTADVPAVVDPISGHPANQTEPPLEGALTGMPVTDEAQAVNAAEPATEAKREPTRRRR